MSNSVCHSATLDPRVSKWFNPKVYKDIKGRIAADEELPYIASQYNKSVRTIQRAIKRGDSLGWDKLSPLEIDEVEIIVKSSSQLTTKSKPRKKSGGVPAPKVQHVDTTLSGRVESRETELKRPLTKLEIFEMVEDTRSLSYYEWAIKFLGKNKSLLPFQEDILAIMRADKYIDTQSNKLNYSEENGSQLTTHTNIPISMQASKQASMYANKQGIDVSTSSHRCIDVDFDCDCDSQLTTKNIMLTVARQHGKSSFILFIYTLRYLCETVWDYIDDLTRPLLYVSLGENITRFLDDIKFNLLNNQAIIDHYGELVGREKKKNMELYKQPSKGLRLTTLRDTFLLSLFTTTTGSGVRGFNFFTVIIDDIISADDVRIKPTSVQKASDDAVAWLKNTMTPMIKGNIFIVGTRFSPTDIFATMKETGTFEVMEYPAIVGGQLPTYEIKPYKYRKDGSIRPRNPRYVVVEEEGVELLSPQLWAHNPTSQLYCGTPIQNLLFKIAQADELAFRQEYLLDPVIVDAKLDIDKMRRFDILPKPASEYTWITYTDPASGRQVLSDISSMVLIGKDKQINEYFIYDIIWGHWDGLQKQNKLEQFVESSSTEMVINSHSISNYIEVVINRDFFHRMVNESELRVIEDNPRGKGEKVERILHGLGVDLDNGVVYLRNSSRSIKRLANEMATFGYTHPDILDAINSGIDMLRTNKSKSFGIMRG